MLTGIQSNNASENLSFRAKFINQKVNKIPRKIRQNITTVAQPKKETLANSVKNIIGEMFPTLDPQYRKVIEQTPKFNKTV